MIASTFSKRLSLALHDDVFETIKRLSNSDKYNFIMGHKFLATNEGDEYWGIKTFIRV